MKEVKYSAALRAIEKLQKIYSVEIIDVNLYELQQCKNENTALEHEIEDFKQEMKVMQTMRTCLEKRIYDITVELRDLKIKYEELPKIKK